MKTALPIVGQGAHQYSIEHDWIMPPEHIRFGDTHGLCQDAQGRIYVAHTVHEDSKCLDAIAVFDDKGKFIKSFGAQFQGGAHGLEIRKESGEEFLYHCDVKRNRFVKTKLDGKVIWDKGAPQESGVYPKGEGFKPTNIAFAPNGDFYVADGYGSSYIHQFSLAGDYIRTIGTPGSEPGQLKCPHGLWVDDRTGEPHLLVADRGNRRFQTFTLDGKHLDVLTQGMRLPCHFKTRGKLLLVPDLESVVMLFDANNRVVAHLGDGHPTTLRAATRSQFIPGQFVHPHGAIFLASGDILVAEWVTIGRVSLLRKLK